MKTIVAVVMLCGLLLAALSASAAPPDMHLWGDLLAKYYDPDQGMNYKALKADDKKTLDELRRQMAQVEVAALSRNDQLAYWINLYNISVVDVVVEHYPVASIKDISTDPILRLNVFKKDSVLTKKGAMSLNDVENDKLRDGFKDPRIHFAINCAARSCPPIRPEPFSGEDVSNQLDDQVRKFLNGPHGVRLEKSNGVLMVHTTKIMDWFKADFEKWGGGRAAFIIRNVDSDKRAELEKAASQVDFAFDDYDWKLNDASK
jgi:hypothetical protein